MFYTIPTKKGKGVELWGSYDDLRTLHHVIGKFWNNETLTGKPSFENRDSLISSFSYEIRKAFEGHREKRVHGHYSLEPLPHFGTHLSWVHVLFSVAALRSNMRFIDVDKLDVALFLQLEYWLEHSMEAFDETGAKALKPYVNGALYLDNPYMYQFMRSINMDYFLFGGGKRAFRQLPSLLKAGVFFTEEYNNLLAHFTKEAKRLNCNVEDLEIDDDHIEYDTIKW